MRAGLPAVALLAALLPPQAAALEIYKWVDDDGVVHYSESRPEEPAAAPVETLHIASTNSPAYDPDDYYWSILNQAERIGEQWSAMQDAKAEQEALARAAVAEQRIEELEMQLAAREAADYLNAQPLYGPFVLRHHPFLNRGFRSGHDLHRPPHHNRDRGNPPDTGARPGWTPPAPPAKAPSPGFSRRAPPAAAPGRAQRP
ncbi:MAG TPA: DUF4124 domain-containing protein [Woeseiaceae bacterium]|nr:DUF4124 domain-containing protein [Woeseiaceae bacterium]